MPRVVGRKKQQRDIKREVNRNLGAMSDFEMSRISDFDSHMSPYPQMSELDFHNSDSDNSMIEEVALIPRKEIKFNDYDEEDQIDLKIQHQERINVEQEENQIYYVTKSIKRSNYQPSKLERQSKRNLAHLIAEKIDYDARRYNKEYGKVLYRVKQESHMGNTEVNLDYTDGTSREVLQIL